MRRLMRATSSNPVILRRLAPELNGTITAAATGLSETLDDHWRGRVGAKAQETTRSLFDLWCGQSLVATPSQAATIVANFLGGHPHDVAGTAGVLKFQCEVPAADADRAATQLIGVWAANQTAAALVDSMWDAYRATRDKFCAQAAHVLLARILLYRVGEDKGLFPERLSGDSWAGEKSRAAAAPWGTTWLFSLLEQVRSQMRGLVPSVYERGEFDWWVVDASHRPQLSAAEAGRLSDHDAALSTALENGIDSLDGYTFKSVDVDVWHDVYQHYLPPEERQRLGGFYTPDELVRLTLDACSWAEENVGICERRLIDPACGSGTFLVQATETLVRHLTLDLACHADVTQAKAPWEKSQRGLERIAKCIHGIDLHPFAAFLATLNVLFVVLESYVTVKSTNPNFVLDLAIFAHDSLEKSKAEEISPGLWQAMNSRVALMAQSRQRFVEVVDRKFDVVVGNPPWGGILKGRLAPVFDVSAKQRLRAEYPHAAQGKYDIYGLFVERGLGWLAPEGRLSLITQDTYFDKEWAADLRKYIATSSRIDQLISIAPFGQLFFHAMNTPAISALTRDSAPENWEVEVVRTHPPAKWAVKGEAKRRAEVVRSVRAALRTKAPRTPTGVGLAYYTPVPQAQLVQSAGTRWQFDSASPIKGPRNPVGVSSLLEHRQGVTPGGALDLYLLDEKTVRRARLEPELARKAFKSVKLRPWAVPNQRLFLLYPYVSDGGRVKPAFSIKHPKVEDALDLDVMLDNWESTRRGRGGTWASDITERRIAQGLVAFPNAARYLVSHYERLERRTFKQQNIRDFGRRWYEYLWPRGAEVSDQVPRIVSPTLVKAEMRFALDRKGLLSDHATVFLVRTKATNRAFAELRAHLAKVRGEPESDEATLLYILASLNSEYAMSVMRRGRNASPKGYYAVNEGFLDEVMIDGRPSKAVAESAIGLSVAEMEAAGVEVPGQK